MKTSCAVRLVKKRKTILLTQKLVLWVHMRWHFLEFWKIGPQEMTFNLQAFTGWLSVPVQTVTTTFLPTLGGKKETHFRRVLVDQFSKFQKMSSCMNPQNQLLSEQNFFGDIFRFITHLIINILWSCDLDFMQILNILSQHQVHSVSVLIFDLSTHVRYFYWNSFP